MITSRRILLLAAILACICVTTKAQYYTFKKEYNTPKFEIQKIEVKNEDNFLNSHINCSYQDVLGFMWFGTINGFCRYDGNEILKFASENSNLPNTIYRILGDDQGKLWVINSLGKELYKNTVLIDIHTFEIQKLKNAGDIQFPEGLYPVEGNDRVIYFINENTEIQYEYKNGELNEIETENIPVYKMNNAEKYERFRKLKEAGVIGLGFSEPSVSEHYFLDIDKSGKLLLRTGEVSDSVYFLEEITADGKRTRMDSFEGYPMTSTTKIRYEPSTDNIWSFNNYGLTVANTKKNLYYDFTAKFPDVFYGETRSIGFYGDVAWVCATNGLFKIKTKHSHFNCYFGNENSSDPFYNTTSFSVDSCGNLLLTTDNHLLRIGTDGIDTISKGSLTPIIEQRGDTILTGTNGIHLFVNYELTDIYLPEEPNGIQTSLRARQFDGGYWLGLERGLGYWEDGMDSLRFFSKYNEFDGLKNGTVTDLKFLENGNVLVASTVGIYEFSEDRGVLARYWEGGEGAYNLPANHYNYIYEDKDGIIWLGSEGGLIKWDRMNVDHMQFTLGNDLSNNRIYGIYEDSLGNLWLPSEKGLTKFNKETYSKRVYTPHDGLNHDRFNKGSFFRTADEEFYFGGENGLNGFCPNDLKDASSGEEPPMRLNKVYHLDDRRQEVDKLELYKKGESIRIRPEDGNLSLEYTLLEYTNVGNIYYSYKIVEEEEEEVEWQYTKDNKIECMGLDYGEYTIRIRGEKANGHFSSNEILLSFTIVKPIYLRAWFIVLSLLAIILGLHIFFRRRNKWFLERAAELESKVREQTFQLEKDKAIIEKQARELLELDKVKSRFFANVSHELRTPITLIQGPVRTILERKGLAADDYRLLKQVEDSTHDLMELVNELLDLTKIEGGNLSLNESGVVFYSFIKRKFSSFQSIAEIKEVGFSLDYQMDKELALAVDKNKLEKILNNLLSNAFKFTPKGGHIHLTIEDRGDDVRIQVKDNGRGIPEEDIPYIFNRFYQSPKNQKAEGGLGIGLALSAEFAKLFEGKLWVESMEGRGSVFFMQFPKKEVAAEDAPSPEVYGLEKRVNETQSGHSPADSGEKKELVLLVEDHSGLQEYIHYILEVHYEVKITENGKEALDWLRQGGLPSLIISDLMMPVMDGFEFLDEIKRSPRFSRIPFIMLTARADSKDKLRALRIGVDDYLTKPFDEKELKARIKNLLNHYRSREEFMKESESGQVISKAAAISEKDRKWMMNLENTILEKISHHSFSVDFLAETMSINRDKLFRKTKELIGLTPNQYVRIIRLQLAKKLLENGDGVKVKDVSIQVGFQKVEYFSKLYKEQYGRSPSEYIR